MPVLINLACHGGAMLGYVLLWTCSFSLYRHWGGVITRGIDIGMASQLIFYVVVAINVVVAVVPSKRVKYGLAGLAGVLILAYLLPDYPLRAPLFAVLATGTTSLAILLAGCARAVPR